MGIRMTLRLFPEAIKANRLNGLSGLGKFRWESQDWTEGAGQKWDAFRKSVMLRTCQDL